MTTDPTRPLSIDGDDAIHVRSDDTYGMWSLPVYFPADMTDTEARALLCRLVDPEAYPMHPDQMAAEIEWCAAERDRLRDTLREVLAEFYDPPMMSSPPRAVVAPATLARWRAVLDATPSPEPTPAAPADDERERCVARLPWGDVCGDPADDVVHDRKLAGVHHHYFTPPSPQPRTSEGLTATGRYDEGQPLHTGYARDVPGDWQARSADSTGWKSPVYFASGEVVECRPPVPVPVPEPQTERVPWYQAQGRRTAGGDLLGRIVQAHPSPVYPHDMYVEYDLPEHDTTGNPHRNADGTVEVLVEDDDQ